MAKCKECEAEIRWIEMESGKMMPCEDENRGLVVMQPNGKAKLVFGHEPHWQNCPAANLFKKKK
jgi:hypothetical protein